MILNNGLLLLLLALAIAAGWMLARSGLRLSSGEQAQLPSQYYRGFNFLLDGEEEGAVDAFTEALAVNEETLGTHIALGSVLRKRGEVDRAIRIHQNLLLRRDLREEHRLEALAGLAGDFQQGGFLRRAIAAHEELLARWPDHVGALRALVRLLADARQFPRAQIGRAHV